MLYIYTYHIISPLFFFKGSWIQFELKIFNFFIFSFFVPRLVTMGIFNDSPKFESQILHYKQDTEVEILCYVNKA